MPAGTIVYRSARPDPENAAKVLRLYQSVYGGRGGLAARWDWEFVRHPRSRDVRLLCAERDGELLGVTARHPVTIRYRGTIVPAEVASNSMVAPHARGRGIIRELYRLASADGALQLSKGTAPAMYRILEQIGYREIRPSSFRSCYLRPVRLALTRVPGLGASGRLAPFAGSEGDEMTPVSCIPDSVGDTPASDGIVKDAAYLSLEVLEIPRTGYMVFLRGLAGSPLSVLVLRAAGWSIYVVDLIWDRASADEPEASLRFAKKAAQRMGAMKMIAWSPHGALRESLRRIGFVDKGVSPGFAWLSTSPGAEIDWEAVNIAHGDGDIDYL